MSCWQLNSLTLMYISASAYLLWCVMLMQHTEVGQREICTVLLILFLIASPCYTPHSFILKMFPSQPTYGDSAIYTCLSSLRNDASFYCWNKTLETFQKYFWIPRLTPPLFPLALISHPALTQRTERAGEGIRFRQLLSPSPSCRATLNCLLANPVRTRQRTLVEWDLRMTCVSLLAYILSLHRLKATGLVRRQAETQNAGSNIPDIVAWANQR